MKVIISGGGTGGHIYPALAIASGIKDRLPDALILYVGTREGLESKIVPSAGFDFVTVDISGLNRSSLLKASASLAKFPRSIFQAWSIIKNFEPQIVVGTGGYVSFPVVSAATLFPGCKTFIHEQNAFPGIANRKLAKKVDCTMINFPEAARHLKAQNIKVTGLPVRQEIMDVNWEEAIKKVGLKRGVFTLLAFGGSRGASSINGAMLQLLQEYSLPEMQVIWITGELEYEGISQQIESLGLNSDWLLLKPFMHNIEDAMAVADLALCRAGASTLSELAILGLPAILVPYPYAAESHQEKNARALLQKKAAAMVIDEFLDGETLYKKLEELRQSKAELKQMSTNIRNEARPDALNKILDIVLKGY
ncbi:MAG: undecaprenyldiphospho-muramoylpentapeptide beta-N-acetylglucosaminyltransferase [Syntrophomonadaceae bacterium]|jgi:UDP-N-acetylglucosamine--N-acetylmuramyl-(pentapeptide) pyrophosphoryl-undecaprenol N-acetylglucosamine transferase|nr:undecaprenyldiphospho-muramoylpentapeptide beta-N-acetylglucosaminyltransferase [Syntrophomonadaceae bacterium]